MPRAALRGIAGRWTALAAALVLALPAAALPNAAAAPSAALQGPADPWRLAERYAKREVHVPMRDGTRLFTAVYTPTFEGGPWPILLRRTPYGLRPYGEDAHPAKIGPSRACEEAGYVFVHQDVRGTGLSEGAFVNMRPQLAQRDGPEDVDESTDAYDTIEWLLANVAGHNGRVGTWGISYPGFYSAAGMIGAHPALAAASPQAPIADWWYDDFHHHGAFFLPHAFNFLASFGRPRPEPEVRRWQRFDHGTPDGYAFFLGVGPLSEANERHFDGQVAFWDELVAHPTYDEFWQARNLLPHLRDVAPAVLVVGGWYDAEDLYGPLAMHRALEEQAPGSDARLVMGPWRHGGWARDPGDRLGEARFGGRHSLWYVHAVEHAFFEQHLRGGPDAGLAEATVFDTGANRWQHLDAWPPPREERALYLAADGALRPEPDAARGRVAWTSDPHAPVPFTQAIATGMTREYMTEDQRFAGRRPDVATWVSEPLAQDLTLAGPLTADLWVTTSGQASDWVVKLCDVLPGDVAEPADLPDGVRWGGAWRMVRSEVLRGRFRDSPSEPQPFEPGVPTRVRVPLQDVLHTFRAGHRIGVQVQCTWFPLVDRNPHRWVENVFTASDDDYVSAEQAVLAGPVHGSALRFGVLEPADDR